MEQQQKITSFINSELTPVKLKCDLEKHKRKTPPKCMSDEFKHCRRHPAVKMDRAGLLLKAVLVSIT